MKRKKKTYLTSLVEDAVNGDSNSFAIIFAITYDTIYKKCHRVIDREYDIQDILFGTYVSVYKKLRTIRNPNRLENWINLIFEGRLSAYLKKNSDSLEKYRKILKTKAKSKEKSLSIDNAEQLLESVFISVNSPAHTVPLESLLAYHVYRNNRLHLQRAFLIVALLALILLPFFSLNPEMEVSKNSAITKANQAHYTIRVRSILPVDTVIATMDSKEITVMIDGDKVYDATATDNGTMTIIATTINGKQASTTINVTGIDKNDPVLDSYEKVDNNIVLFAHDDESGIDYTKTCVTKISDGTVYYPESTDSEKGQITLPYFTKDTALVIYDNAGNYVSYSVTP